MSRSDRERIADIWEVATELRQIVERGRGLVDTDFTVRRALERCLEIMGEASKSVSEQTRAQLAAVPWVQLARSRDLLSHHYHRVEPHLLWRIAADDVPPIEAALFAWLEAHPDELEPGVGIEPTTT